eukprot:scaffold7114_cov264-Pinguiococcus_pyrenoidosus.AAC.9
MVVLHRLAHVDEHHLAIVVQHVILGQIAVHQAAAMEHQAHLPHHLPVATLQALQTQVRIFQPRSRPSLGPEKLHHQHVPLQQHRLRARNAGILESPQVADLLLGPHRHHLPRVAPAVPVSEAPLSGDVLVSVFEHQDGGLVDLDGQFLTGAAHCVVDVGLLARAEAAVELSQKTPAQHLEEHHSGLRVQHLLARGPLISRVVQRALHAELLALHHVLVHAVRKRGKRKFGHCGCLQWRKRRPLHSATEIKLFVIAQPLL